MCFPNRNDDTQTSMNPARTSGGSFLAIGALMVVGCVAAPAIVGAAGAAAGIGLVGLGAAVLGLAVCAAPPLVYSLRRGRAGGQTS